MLYLQNFIGFEFLFANRWNVLWKPIIVFISLVCFDFFVTTYAKMLLQIFEIDPWT